MTRRRTARWCATLALLAVTVLAFRVIAWRPRPVPTADLPDPFVRVAGVVHVHTAASGCFRHQLLLPRPYLVLTKPLRLRTPLTVGGS